MSDWKGAFPRIIPKIRLDKQDDRSYNFCVDKKTKRTNEIIRDSINIMYLKGYNGTSVKDIVDAAGIPKGSFYNYFEDKEHYAIDAVHYYQYVLIRDIIAIFEEESLAPLDRIKAYFTNGAARLVEIDLNLGCFVGNLAQEMGNISEAISEELAYFYDRISLLIYNNLVEAKENGELRKDVNLESLASFILSGWQGALLRAKVTKDRKVLDEFLSMLNEVLLT